MKPESDIQTRHRKLREEMKARRESLTDEQLKRCCAALQEEVLSFLNSHPAFGSLMTYYPIKKEARPFDLQELMRLMPEKTILLPRVEKQNPPELAAVPFRGVGETPGSFSGWKIFEPAGEPYPPEQIDCVLVPGLAFDRQGFRLGYGKGFYDAFLPRLKPGTPMIGIGYGFQLTENTFPQPHDVKLTGLITENGLLFFE